MNALLGTSALGPRAIRAKLKGAAILRDLEAMLSGSKGVDEQLNVLASDVKRPKTLNVYRITRVTALVLHAYARRLPGTMQSNFYPPETDFGLWGPAFRVLGMPTVAKQWGQPSFAFPFVEAKAKVKRAPWPLMTCVEGASLAKWRKELSANWRPKVKALPLRALDPDAESEETAYFTREELSEGLAQLAKWVKAVSAPNALVLVLDGDQ